VTIWLFQEDINTPDHREKQSPINLLIPLKSATGSDSNRPPVPTENGRPF
jgi:hypothetical protein